MPAAHFDLMRAHIAHEPPMEDRIGFYLCQIAAMVANTSMNRAKGSESMKATEIDPWGDPWGEIAAAKAEHEMDAIEKSLKGSK